MWRLVATAAALLACEIQGGTPLGQDPGSTREGEQLLGFQPPPLPLRVEKYQGYLPAGPALELASTVHITIATAPPLSSFPSPTPPPFFCSHLIFSSLSKSL